MEKRYSFYYIVLIAMFLLHSCGEDTALTQQPPAPRREVQQSPEAKLRQYLEEHLADLSLPNLGQTVYSDSSPQTRAAPWLRYAPRAYAVHWDSVLVFSHGEMGTTCLFAMSPQSPLFGFVHTSLDASTQARLTRAHFKLGIRLTPDSIYSSVFTYMPDYRQADTDVSRLGYDLRGTDFSGLFLVSGLDGTFYYGQQYDKGRIAMFIEPRNPDTPPGEGDVSVCLDLFDAEKADVQGLSGYTDEDGRNLGDGIRLMAAGMGGAGGAGSSGSGLGGAEGSGGTGGDGSGIGGTGGGVGGSGSGGGGGSYTCSSCGLPVDLCNCNYGITICRKCGMLISECICNQVCPLCRQYPCVCGVHCQKCGSQTCDGSCDKKQGFEPGGGGGGTETGNNGNGKSSGGQKSEGSGAGLPGLSSVAPNASKLFENQNLIDDNWRTVERMVEKIMDDCMGSSLYYEMVRLLNGKKLAFSFIGGKDSDFNFRNGQIRLGMEAVESNRLLHELFHAYQAYQETQSTFENSIMNQEIEAHFAQYLYLKKLKEYPGSKWEKWYTSGHDKRLLATKNLERYVTDKGFLKASSNEYFLQTYIDTSVIELYQKTPGYENLKFDTGRELMSNFKNIQTLTKDC